MTRWQMLRWVWVAVLAAAGGCGPLTIQQRLASRDPRVRVAAVRELEASAAPQSEARLIELLADDDVVVRFYAGAALYRRVGQRLDYEPQGSLRDRAAAIRRWMDWYDQRHPGAPDEFAALRDKLKALEPTPSESAPSESARSEAAPGQGAAGPAAGSAEPAALAASDARTAESAAPQTSGPKTGGGP